LGKKKEGVGIRIVEMNSDDIQRSPIVSKLLKIYEDRPVVRDSVTLSPSHLGGTNYLSNTTFSRETTVPSDTPSLLEGINGPLDIYKQNLTAYYSKTTYSDAALIPSRYNVTDNRKFPWTPMDL
jgi:hypothetical protein